MRVLFVTHCFGDEVNGPVIYTRLLWEHFSSDHDIEFHLLALEVPSNIQHPNLHVVPKEQQSSVGHLNLKLLAKHAQRLAQSFGSATLVHLNAAHIPYRGDWRDVICNVNDTVVAKGNLWLLARRYGLKRGLSFFYRKSAERKAVRSARRVIANSEYTAEVLRRAYGDSRSIEVIYKAVDCAAFADVKEARKERYQALRAGQLAQISPWRLLTVGSNWEYKRLDLLLESLHELRKQREDFHLDVYGQTSASERQRFVAIAAGLELSDLVTFHGPVSRSDLKSAFQISDIFVTANPHEAFGVAVVEALACGLEVVAFASGGIKEILAPPKLCPVIAAGDTRGFAKAIFAAMQRGRDPDVIVTQYQRACEFDKRFMLNHIEAVYRLSN